MTTHSDPTTLPIQRNNMLRSAEDTWDETGVKTSERFLSFLEAEYTREIAKSRVIDDRAKSIVTLAAVALPAVGLLKPAQFSLGYILAVLVTLAFVTYTLWLTAAIFRNRDGDTMAVSWFQDVQPMVYREQVWCADLLGQIQIQLTDQLKQQREVNEERFDILDHLHVALLAVLGFATLAILVSLLPSP